MEFDPQQAEAIRKCIDINVRCWPVTGSAGTGKTTIEKEIVTALKAAGYNVMLAAPVARAAKRITEITGFQAVTLHRLLEFPKPGERDKKSGKYLRTSEPKRDRFNPLELDFLIVDEYEMVNWALHRQLLDAMPRGSRLRVFGDIQQLRPIEEKGAHYEVSAFQDLLRKFTGTTLTTIHRQTEGSGISENARGILLGKVPKKTHDFELKLTEQPISAMEEAVLDAANSDIDFNILRNQIITPMNKYWTGTTALNTALQRCFMENIKEGYLLERHDWDKTNKVYLQPGDKVVNKQNWYDLEWFNGEVGIVQEITELGEIIVADGERKVTIPPILEVEVFGGTALVNPQKDIQLAYALNTHNVIGCEFDNVIYVLNKSSRVVQCRPNFYTAVTRARKHDLVITDQFSLVNSVSSPTSFLERQNAKTKGKR